MDVINLSAASILSSFSLGQTYSSGHIFSAGMAHRDTRNRPL